MELWQLYLPPEQQRRRRQQRRRQQQQQQQQEEEKEEEDDDEDEIDLPYVLCFDANYDHTQESFPDRVNMLLVNRQLYSEAMEIFFKYNTFTFSCFPSEILDFMKSAPPRALQKIQRLRFMAPSMQVVGSTVQYGHTNVVWDEDPVDQYKHWEEIIQFMSQMRLKEVTFEMPVGPEYDCYYWPVMRRIVGRIEDGKITGCVRLTDYYGYYLQTNGDIEDLGAVRMMRMRWAEARKDKKLTQWRRPLDETDEWELKLDQLMQEAEKEKETLKFVARYEKCNEKYLEGMDVVILERNNG